MSYSFMRLLLPHSGLQWENGKPKASTTLDKLFAAGRVNILDEYCRTCGEFSGISEPEFKPQYCVYCTKVDRQGTKVDALVSLYRDVWISTEAQRMLDHPFVTRFDIAAAVHMFSCGRADIPIPFENRDKCAVFAQLPFLCKTLLVVLKLPTDLQRHLIEFLEPS